MFPLSKKEVKPVITHESKQPTGIQPGSQTPEVVLIRIFKIHKFSSVSDKKKNTLSPSKIAGNTHKKCNTEKRGMKLVNVSVKHVSLSCWLGGLSLY